MNYIPRISQKLIQYFGYFENGQAVGRFWIQMQGSGFLHGKVDSNGMISGDEIAYIYPDGETALLGKFEDRVMKNAFHVKVEEFGCDSNGLFYVKKLSEKLSDQNYIFEIPTNTSWGGGGLHPDPYETKFLNRQESSGKFYNNM